MGNFRLLIGLVLFAFSEIADASDMVVCSRSIKRPELHGLRFSASVLYKTVLGVKRWSIYEEEAPIDLSGLDSFCIVVPIGTTEASWNDIIDPAAN
jgi:hypothetical protein